jgi:hypothetical protein
MSFSDRLPGLGTLARLVLACPCSTQASAFTIHVHGQSYTTSMLAFLDETEMLL